MPNLPTIFVTDAQANRLLAAFGTADAYKAWLKSTLIDYVIQSEERAEYEAWAKARLAKSEQAKAELSA